MRAVVIMAVAVLVVGCAPEREKVGRKFQSMDECISFIRADLGESLKVVTDKPGDISGISEPSKLFFRCELMVTGTQGTFLEGRWDRLKKKTE